jgi:hypothetical protein
MQQPFVDYSHLESLGVRPQQAEDDGVDWASLTAPPAEEKEKRSGDPFEMDQQTGEGGKGDDDDDDEFTVFDGFGQDNKPFKAVSGKAGEREGMMWDAERKVWERQNQHSFGSFGSGFGRGGGSSPWGPPRAWRRGCLRPSRPGAWGGCAWRCRNCSLGASATAWGPSGC